MNLTYDPTICDLCGCEESSVLLDLATGRSMNSDRRIVDCNLKKMVCKRCGLVRSGQPFDEQELHDYYVYDYTLNVQPEYYFYTPQGPIARSKILCDWIVSAMGAHRWLEGQFCLEIGAGAGMLMQKFVQRFPDVIFEGVELNKKAADLAQKQGLSVHQGSITDLNNHKYDLIYAIGVIEHVTSPTEFLIEIYEHLKPGGLLFLCQPTQDICSYDLFFFDHLYHFGSEHLHQYSKKCGFHERGFVVGNEWMPSFSLHLWQASGQPDSFNWIGPQGYTTCLSTASSIVADMTRLDEALVNFAAKRQRVAVFGPGEVYWLAHTYSTLGDFPIVCGLDDRPENPEFDRLKFPVIVPEDCLSLGIQDVILTMNKVYYQQACQRLKRLGLDTHIVLSLARI